MTFPRPRGLWALLTLVSSLAWADPARTSPLPPDSRPRVGEARPERETQDTAQLLEWLVSTDPARSAEAQIRLLAVGETVLPPLESLAAHTRHARERGQVREFLRVLTAYSLRVEQLASYPTLALLARQDVARGLQLVVPWEAVESTGGVFVKPWVSEAESLFGCGGLSNGDSSVEDHSHAVPSVEGAALESLRDALAPLGGLAGPALERLLSSSSVSVRLRGLALASDLKLRPGSSLSERLRVDETRVELEVLQRGKRARAPQSMAWLEMGLEGALAETSEGGISHVVLRIERRSARWFAIATVPGYAPFTDRFDPLSAQNLLYAHAPAGLARDEQEYWNVLRPLWRAWWRSAPWDSSTRAAQQWNELAREAHARAWNEWRGSASTSSPAPGAMTKP